jgi:ubiquitin-conjugating enzyme E2 I
VSQVLNGIQQLLSEPNELSPAQADAYMYYTKKPDDYRKRILSQAKQYAL